MTDRNSPRQERADALFDGMTKPVEGKDYYSIMLTADEQNRPTWSVYSKWVGFKSTQPLIEIRIASLIKAHQMAEHWRSIGEPFLVVNDATQLFLYLSVGGRALLEKQAAAQHWKEVLAPFECISDAGLGFVGITIEDVDIANRAPSKKLRMQVLKRDQFRCRVCGRRPTDHVDVELHVHHVRPWGEGGPTHERNLITLCQTCHNGLDPHFEHRLFGLFDRPTGAQIEEGVRRYRYWVASRSAK